MRSYRFPRLRPVVAAGVALVAVALTAGPASAAAPGTSAALMGWAYWDRFKDFWLGGLRQQNGIVLAVVGTGILSLFIITRGKWAK